MGILSTSKSNSGHQGLTGHFCLTVTMSQLSLCKEVHLCLADVFLDLLHDLCVQAPPLWPYAVP